MKASAKKKQEKSKKKNLMTTTCCEHFNLKICLFLRGTVIKVFIDRAVAYLKHHNLNRATFFGFGGHGVGSVPSKLNHKYPKGLDGCMSAGFTYQ